MIRNPGDNIELWLSDYERDNLLAVLTAIAQLPGPQQSMNTGDWNMQVLYKLGWQGDKTEWGSPNHGHIEMAQQCRTTRCIECELPQRRIV